MMTSLTDDDFMLQALGEAHRAADDGEVPIGAVVVKDGRIIGRGANACERLHDATAHAEIVAISAAGQALGTWRLEGCTLYATIEPCPMCMGACLNARIQRVVFGAMEPKAGACGSVVDLRAPAGYNHAMTVAGGVRAAEAAKVMQDFFRALRRKRDQEP